MKKFPAFVFATIIAGVIFISCNNNETSIPNGPSPVVNISAACFDLPTSIDRIPNVMDSLSVDSNNVLPIVFFKKTDLDKIVQDVSDSTILGFYVVRGTDGLNHAVIGKYQPNGSLGDTAICNYTTRALSYNVATKIHAWDNALGDPCCPWTIACPKPKIDTVTLFGCRH